MSEVATIAVWDVLKEFGFSPDSSVTSFDGKPGLSLDFGNFKLDAFTAISTPYDPVFVYFDGIRATRRTLGHVTFRLPLLVESREQLAAFLVYYLDIEAKGDQKVFHPEREVAWISEGRQNRHLLPWEVSMAAYRSRPHCSVQRDWLRLGLKSLAELCTKVDDAAEVEISFDGSVLLIKCSEKVVAMSAHGNPWSTQFTIPAGKLRHLPKRLLREEVEIAVYQGRLQIGQWSFDGIKENALNVIL